jgi:hypothetical protein
VAALRLHSLFDPIVRFPRPFIKELIAKCSSSTSNKPVPTPSFRNPRLVLNKLQRRPLLTSRARRKPLLPRRAQRRAPPTQHIIPSPIICIPRRIPTLFFRPFQAICQIQERLLVFHPGPEKALAFYQGHASSPKPSNIRPRKPFSSPTQAQKYISRLEKDKQSIELHRELSCIRLKHSLLFAYEGSVGFFIMIDRVG